MIRVVGMESGKIYAEGRHGDCFRKLNQKYPYKMGVKKILSSEYVYPEPLKVYKLGGR